MFYQGFVNPPVHSVSNYCISLRGFLGPGRQSRQWFYYITKIFQSCLNRQIYIIVPGQTPGKVYFICWRDRLLAADSEQHTLDKRIERIRVDFACKILYLQTAVIDKISYS